MIEILDGMYETINYGDSLGIRLFHNDEYEDYPEHWHTGIEMIMPVENGYTVCTGKENYELRQNDVIIINTGVLHSLKAPETGKRIILQFSASLLYSVKEMETLLAMLPPIVYIPYDTKDEKLYEFVRSRMDRIVTEYDEKKTFRESLIYAQLIEMFVTLGRVVMEGLYEKNEIVSDGQVTKHKEYIETVMGTCNYINQHYQENITLEEVASVSGFSKFHFTRIFKQCMDMTFYEYLNEKRITKAEELLYTTVLSVTDIAMQSGFSSISSFNRTFKTMKGCSPSEYRNKMFVCKE